MGPRIQETQAMFAQAGHKEQGVHHWLELHVHEQGVLKSQELIGAHEIEERKAEEWILALGQQEGRQLVPPRAAVKPRLGMSLTMIWQ